MTKLPALLLLLLAILAPNLCGGLLVREGDVFNGQFEMGGLEEDALFVLRAHSTLHGAFTWFTGFGHMPGWMTHCTFSDVDCAGGALTKPLFGALAVPFTGNCTDENTCSAPPLVQPGTGCIEYGCQIPACGCNLETANGCWGRNMTGQIALIQRGYGVGEPVYDGQCTFSRKITLAEYAGASAVVMINHAAHEGIIMQDDGQHLSTIPAVLATRDAGMILWDMLQEVGERGKVEVWLTNQTENSLRLTVTGTSMSRGHQQVEGIAEFRLEAGGIGDGDADHHALYPYGSFRVVGTQEDSGALVLRPKCLETTALQCSSADVHWLQRPELGDQSPARSHLPFGMSLLIREPGMDGVDFEHLFGHVVDNGAVDPLSRVRLRKTLECRPEILFVQGCVELSGRGLPGQLCLSALDNKGYRTFNDLQATENLHPLFWHCRGTKYCEGDYLTETALRSGLIAHGLAPNIPDSCEAGKKNGYLHLGPQDWGTGVSMFECGFGDRSDQHSVCQRLPSTPTANNPSGWYFNTSCLLVDGTPCGHSSRFPYDGWYMEGEVIASCARGEHCEKHDSASILDLYLHLDHEGSVAFTFTAHGEAEFDYIAFSVNGVLTFHTAMMWSMGRVLERVSVPLPAGDVQLTWEWVKDMSVSDGDDMATLHEIFITGSEADTTCSDCPPGTCGNGGLQGCVVCARDMKAPQAGSTTCESCGAAVGGIHTGPEDWPASGNQETCGWIECQNKPEYAVYVLGPASNQCEWDCMEGFFRSGGISCAPCANANALFPIHAQNGAFASTTLPYTTTLLDWLKSFGVRGDSEATGTGSWVSSHSGDLALQSWWPCLLDPQSDVEQYFQRYNRVRVIDGGGAGGDDWAVFNFGPANGGGDFDASANENAYFGGGSEFGGGSAGFENVYGAVWGEDLEGVWRLLYALPLGPDAAGVGTNRDGHWFSSGGVVTSGWGKRQEYDSLAIISVGFSVAPLSGVVCGAGTRVELFECVKCTSKPAQSQYVATENGNECSWECLDGYHPQDAACVPCDTTGFRGNGKACVSCDNMPPDAHYTSPGKAEWDFACEWECDAGFEKDASGGCKACTGLPEHAVASGTCEWYCEEGWIAAGSLCEPQVELVLVITLNATKKAFEEQYRAPYKSAVASVASLPEERVTIGSITELVMRRAGYPSVIVQAMLPFMSLMQPFATLLGVTSSELSTVSARLQCALSGADVGYAATRSAVTREKLQALLLEVDVLHLEALDTIGPEAYAGQLHAPKGGGGGGGGGSAALAISLSLLGVAALGVGAGFYVRRQRQDSRWGRGGFQKGIGDGIPLTEL